MQDLTLGNLYSIIAKLILLMGLGFFLYRKKVLNEQVVKFLADLLIKVCVPCLIFTNLTQQLAAGSGPSVWSFVTLSLLIFFSGALLGMIFIFFVKNKSISRETVALTAFQNCGYLPMNIVYFLFSSPARERLLSYIFLYILGFNILMWSIGSFFIFKKRREVFKAGSLLNPPVLSIIAALIFRKILPTAVLPDVIFSPMQMVGQMSFVLSMLVLGAGLAKAGFARVNAGLIFNIVSISILKLVALPFLFALFIIRFNIGGLFGFFVLLEACMPSAASLPIITRWKGADYEFTSQVVFFTHIFCLISVPFWIRFFFSLNF